MRLRHLALASTALVAAGCVRTRSNVARLTQTATLEVRNSYIAPVDIYVQRDQGGSEFRIGQVYANRTQQFSLDGQIIGGMPNLVFIAVPASTQARPSMGRAIAAPIVIRPMDLVRFNITTDLRSSTAFLVR